MTTPDPSRRSPFRRRLAALCIATACAAGVAVVGAAESADARPRAPFVTSLEIGCNAIASEARGLYREYKDATPARRSQILREISKLGRRWNQIGCRGAYGDLGTKSGSVSSDVLGRSSAGAAARSRMRLR